MLFHVLLFLVGIVVLYFGAEGLVEGASSVALEYGIRPVVVGLTVVALGTSMPEFLVNFFAIFANESTLALGNIIGSNICNIALILGTSALILPLTVTPDVFRREYPIMFGVMVLFYLTALDGTIGREDGIFMVILLGIIGAYFFYDTRRNPAPLPDEDLDSVETTMSPLAQGTSLVGGIVGLALGAHLMVDNARIIAYEMGISTVVVGITIVAIGTSLPEMAASMVGAVKGESDLSVGNVMGSNLLNVLFVVGVTSIISPLQVEPETLRLHFPAMLVFCALILPVAWTGYRISRVGGSLLVVGFLGYMTYLVSPYL